MLTCEKPSCQNLSSKWKILLEHLFQLRALCAVRCCRAEVQVQGSYDGSRVVVVLTSICCDVLLISSSCWHRTKAKRKTHHPNLMALGSARGSGGSIG